MLQKVGKQEIGEFLLPSACQIIAMTTLEGTSTNALSTATHRVENSTRSWCCGKMDKFKSALANPSLIL